MKEVDFFSPGARLALELECLLMDTRNDAAQSRWWDSAHEALEQWRQAVRAMEASIDAVQRPADDEVVFIDGVGAGRSSIKSCRDGVQWVVVGDRVYWPLSDSDAKRLQSACCGNGRFDGPSTAAQPEARSGGEAEPPSASAGVGGKMAEVVRFLMGEAPLEGRWFDEPDPHVGGAYWWRKHLTEALAQQPAATSETVNVIGMPEFDGLLDHIYEHGTAAEGVIEKANAFARAVIARYAPQQPALLMMEEREQRDEALLRQALEALELRCGTNADERKELIPALRERLG